MNNNNKDNNIEQFPSNDVNTFDIGGERVGQKKPKGGHKGRAKDSMISNRSSTAISEILFPTNLNIYAQIKAGESRLVVGKLINYIQTNPIEWTRSIAVAMRVLQSGKKFGLAFEMHSTSLNSSGDVVNAGMSENNTIMRMIGHPMLSVVASRFGASPTKIVSGPADFDTSESRLVRQIYSAEFEEMLSATANLSYLNDYRDGHVIVH
jgi:hypothetical protein